MPLGGYCLDITRPVGHQGVGVADGAGMATTGLVAPPFLESQYCFQAAIVRGVGGIVSALSDVHCVTFCSVDDDDGDSICNEYDACLGDDATGDSDGDGVCDSDDECPGEDDFLESDGDGVPDCLDPCPADNPDDSDGDFVCDSDDVCLGDDATGDSDGDAICDSDDVCIGDDATGDSDGDTVCDSDDLCPGEDDLIDGDGDGTPDCYGLHLTIPFVGGNTAGGCSYNGQHAFKWDNLGTMPWKACLEAASARGAMLYSSNYSVTYGWSTHRNGANAMVSIWSSYSERAMTGNENCIVGRDPAATRDTDVLSETIVYDGDVWAYQDLGSMYYDQCATAASNAGAMIISPSVIGSGSYINYWVNSVHMCCTYEYLTGAASYGYDNVGGGARSSLKNCMIGHLK
jgi:hypothetical protein